MGLYAKGSLGLDLSGFREPMCPVQDTPSWWAGHDASVQSTHQPTEEEKEQYESEMVEMIQEHKHFPCIVNWVVGHLGWQTDLKLAGL